MDAESVKKFLVHGVSGFVIPDMMGEKKEKFADIDTTVIIIIVVIGSIFLTLTVLESVAAYRLTGGSIGHTVLCVLFGLIYIGIMWVYWGLTNKKLVKH